MEIAPFVSAIEKQKLNCEGIVVLRHGEKIAEHRWIPEAPRSCRSVSKSFISIAVGMAIDRGKLSLDSRAADAFPELVRGKSVRGRRLAGKAQRLAALTLGHLLTMSRGHKKFSRPATVAEALAQPLTFQPGSRFVYDNGSTFLASAMFTRAMGITARDFLLDALFRPLGMGEPPWPESADGHTNGATGLVLTTSNLARFGQFLLQRGRWEGQQLVSPAWIDYASRPQINTRSRRPDNDLGYGCGFWPCRHGAYRAAGINGQFIIVLPRQDAVIATNANEPHSPAILSAVWDEILPLLG
jgi:CubicO group peptidase (beta-lactamase class C family)